VYALAAPLRIQAKPVVSSSISSQTLWLNLKAARCVGRGGTTAQIIRRFRTLEMPFNDIRIIMTTLTFFDETH
jgi:hypothetical protein